MKRKCDICGVEADEHFMESMFTGRKTEWWCWDCWKNAQYEAVKSEMQRQKKLHQLHNSKQRNR